MGISRRPWFRRPLERVRLGDYALALVVTSIALAVVAAARLVFHGGLVGERAELLFGAIAFSAWWGGLGPGLTAAALATLAGTYPLPAELAVGLDTPHLVSISLPVLASEAVVVAALCTYVGMLQRRAQADAAAMHVPKAVTDEALAYITTDELFGHLVRAIPDLLGIDGAAVLLRDEGGTELTVMESSGTGMPVVGTTVPVGRCLAGRAMAARRPLVTEQLDPSDPGDAPWSRGRTGTLVAVPLVAEQRAIGALCLGSRGPRGVTAGEMQAAQILGDCLTVLIQRARAFAIERAARSAAERTARAESFLADTSAALAGLMDEDRVLASVAGMPVPQLGDWCVIDVAEPGGRLRRVAVTHADPAKAEAARTLAARYPAGATDPYGPGLVLRTGEASLFSRAQSCPPGEPTNDVDEFRALMGELGIYGVLAVPLRPNGQTLGVLSFLSADPAYEYTRLDLAFARDFAGRVAVAMDEARRHRADQEAVRAREDLLIAASHELRTPLSHIKGFISTLRQPDVKWDEQTRADFLAEAEREADRLARLIGDLLDLARVKRRGLAVAATCPAELVAGGLDRVRGSLGDHPIASHVPTDLPPVCVDAATMERVVANLLENAAKYSPDGSPIAVSAAAVDGRKLELAVEDRGPGIPDALLERVFEPFLRAAGPSVSGAGLGLWIARSIVHAHGGQIRAENRPEGGARLVITLPLPAVSSGAVAAPSDPAA